MRRIFLDTSALIALERGRFSMRQTHRLALATDTPLLVLTPVIAEWWRAGRREKIRDLLLRSCVVERPDVRVAKRAGDAMGSVGATVVDALVMAAASIEGDTVYTSDVDDFERLLDVFPNVRVERA